jgi:hypothetical protein
MVLTSEDRRVQRQAEVKTLKPPQCRSADRVTPTDAEYELVWNSVGCCREQQVVVSESNVATRAFT